MEALRDLAQGPPESMGGLCFRAILAGEVWGVQSGSQGWVVNV